MQLTKLRAAPVLRAEVPPCASAGWTDGGTASQLIRGVRQMRVSEELARACVAGDVTTMRDAFRRGVNPDARFRGATLLHWAAQENRADLVRVLLAAGANPNAAHRGVSGGHRPLHVAAGAGYVTVVRHLLRAGAKTTYQARGMGTPLHLAAAYGHLNCARALVRAGADVAAKDGEGKRPIHYARRYGHEAVVKYLREHESA